MPAASRAGRRLLNTRQIWKWPDPPVLLGHLQCQMPRKPRAGIQGSVPPRPTLDELTGSFAFHLIPSPAPRAPSRSISLPTNNWRILESLDVHKSLGEKKILAGFPKGLRLQASALLAAGGAKYPKNEPLLSCLFNSNTPDGFCNFIKQACSKQVTHKKITVNGLCPLEIAPTLGNNTLCKDPQTLQSSNRHLHFTSSEPQFSHL